MGDKNTPIPNLKAKLTDIYSILKNMDCNKCQFEELCIEAREINIDECCFNHELCEVLKFFTQSDKPKPKKIKPIIDYFKK